MLVIKYQLSHIELISRPVCRCVSVDALRAFCLSGVGVIFKVLKNTGAMHWLAIVLYPGYVVAFYLRLWLELWHWRVNDARERSIGGPCAILCTATLSMVEYMWELVEEMLTLLEEVVHEPNALPWWMKTFDISHYPLRPDYCGTE